MLGTEPGAFHRPHRGHFTGAQGHLLNTLFLDKVCSYSPNLQGRRPGVSPTFPTKVQSDK